MKITMDLTFIPILLALLVCSSDAYSKYGRTCKDIGCLPSETCVISQDSCSWGQQDGKECGSFPTCKKSSTLNGNHSPGTGTGSSGAPDNTVTRRPYSPPPSNTNVGGNTPPVQPNPSGSIYPQVPSAPSAPSAPSYPGGHDSRPAQPNPYDPYGSRDRDPYGGRDPYDRNKNKGSSDDSGSSLSGLFNILRGGGSSGGGGTRYGSGGSGGGLSYGDIFNALAGGGSNRGGSGGGGLSDILNSFGNRGYGGSSGSGGGFSDILNSFGNRGSGGSSGFGGGSSGGSGLTDILFGRGGAGSNSRGGSGGSSSYGGGSNDRSGYDDRNRQQPQPGSSGSGDSGFLSSLSGFFGRQVTDSLVRNALNGNRGGSSSFGGSGGGGGSDFLNSFRYGGLFNENNGHGQNKPKVTVSGAGPGGYPTQAPAYPTQANAYQPQSYSPNQSMPNGNANYNGATQSQPTQKPQPYGWSVGQH